MTVPLHKNIKFSKGAIGFHIIAELSFFKETNACNKENLLNFLQTRINDLHLNLKKLITHNYFPHGFSIIAIVGESHIALHSWPEYHYISVDIFLCTTKEIVTTLYNDIKNFLAPKHSYALLLERNIDSIRTELL